MYQASYAAGSCVPTIGDCSTSIASTNSDSTFLTRTSTRPRPRKDQRWSEVVPPDAGLSFAAVFDPDEGLMTFSGAQLLASARHLSRAAAVPVDETAAAAYHDEDDDGMLSVERSPMTTSSMAANVGMLASFYRDQFEGPPPTPPTPVRPRCARASSTCEGIDVYHHAAKQANRHWSVFDRLDGDPAFDSHMALGGVQVDRRSRVRPSSDVTDDGAVLVELNLSSAFSVSTSSTSEFVEVGLDDDDDDDGDTLRSWTTVCAPGLSMYDPPPSRRRLRKRPPADRPTPPAQVLSRVEYNHTTPALPLVPNVVGGGGTLKKLADRLGRLKRPPEDKWVLVDVMHTLTVTQRLV